MPQRTKKTYNSVKRNKRNKRNKTRGGNGAVADFVQNLLLTGLSLSVGKKSLSATKKYREKRWRRRPNISY